MFKRIKNWFDKRKITRALLNPNITKTEKALSKLNISIRNADGSFRTLGEGFDELGEVWNKFSKELNP